jgi:hypothetical protein
MATKQNAVTGFSTKQAMAGFAVSDMTIYTWRNQPADPLPSHKDGNKVVFKEAELVKWAKKTGRTFDAVKAAAGPVQAKTGPKPAPVKKEAAPKVKAVAKPAVVKTAPVKVKPARTVKPKAQAQPAA